MLTAIISNFRNDDNSNCRSTNLNCNSVNNDNNDINNIKYNNISSKHKRNTDNIKEELLAEVSMKLRNLKILLIQVMIVIVIMLIIMVIAIIIIHLTI